MEELISSNATLNLDNKKSNLSPIIGLTNPLVPTSDKINNVGSVDNLVSTNDLTTKKDISPSILDLKNEELNNVILPPSSTSKTSVISNSVTSKSSTADTGIDPLTGLKVNEAVIDNSKPDSLTNPSASQSQTLTGILPDTKTPTDATNNNTEQPKGNVTSATSQSKTTDASTTSTENKAIAPAIEKPSISVVETSPVTNKTAVTSESENKAIVSLESESTTPVSSEKPVVTTKSSSSATGDKGAIASNTPAKNPDSAVVTNNNSGSLASKLSKSDTAVVTTAAATSEPAKTETEVTSTNSGAIASNTPAKNSDSAVVTNNNSGALASKLSKSDTAVVTTAAATSEPAKTETDVTSTNSGAIASNTPAKNPDSAVVTNNNSGALASKLSKSDTAVVTTAAATSEPAKTETDVTSTNSGAIAPAIDKPSVSVVETSPVTNKTAVTSESENKALASTSDITDSSQTPKNSINSTSADVTKTSITSTAAQNITQLTSQSFTFNTGVFKVDQTGKVGIDYLFDGGGYEGELGIFNLDGMEKLAQNSDAFITEAARRSVSNSNLGYVVINDATEGARFKGALPYDINRDRGEYKGVKTFTMLPGDTFALILVPNGANLQQVANKSATGDDARPLFSLPMANPNGSLMTGQIADVTGIGNTFVMEDLRVDKSGTDSDYNDIIFQVRGATGSAVSIDSVINPKKEWRSTDLGKALTEYAKAYVTPENPKVGELVTDELYDSVFGNKDNQVDNASKTGVIASEVSKSDTPVVTAPATSDPAKTETEVTSTNSDELAPAIKKPSVSVEETSPVADKAAVTSEGENKAIAPLDSGSTTPVSPQQSVVTTESSSSVTGDEDSFVSDTPKNLDSAVVTNNNSGAIAKPSVSVVETSPVTDKAAVTSENKAIAPLDSGSTIPVSSEQSVVATESSSSVKGDRGAIVSDTPKNPDSAVVTNNNSGTIASEVPKSDTPVVTAPATSDPAKTKTDVTSTNSGESTPAIEKPSVSVVEKFPVTDKTAVTSESENKAIEPLDSGATTPVSAETSPVTDKAAVTSENKAIAIYKPLPGDNVGAIAVNSTSTSLVNEWSNELSKDLENIEASNKQMLEQFKNEIVEVSNNLNPLESNFWTTYYTVQENTSNQLHDAQSALNNTQTSQNQLGYTISSYLSPMSDQLYDLGSYTSSSKYTAINSANKVDAAISDANKQMFDLYRNLVDELTQNGGTHNDVWQQVYALNDYRSNEINKDWGEYNTLVENRENIFNNAWSEYETQFRNKLTISNDSWNQYYASLLDIYNSWNQYYALEKNRTNILDNALNEYYNLKNQRSQVTSDAWSDYYALNTSWSEWVADTKDEIKTWTKVLSDSEALFSGDKNPWDENQTNNPKVGLPLVGIIDTGFAAGNPDIDYSRITLGKDLADGDDNPLINSSELWRDNHGTKILEIIAATRNNGIGIDGINDKSPLWLGSAVGSKNWAQSLIEFVDAAKKSGQPNALVNLSFDLTQTNSDGSVTTRYELTSVERAALTYAQRNNVLVVAAAGNQGGTMSALGQAVKEFDNIITVGSAEGWNRADYSSYGEVDYDNYGKGVDILAQGKASNGASGSSVAAAKVTGAASLMWAANPNLNFTQIVDILKRTATDLNTPGWDATTGLGLLNIPAAVYLAKATEAEVYTPRGFDLVQDTLKSHNIPTAYWPEFYKAYYYYDLEAKLETSAWTGAGAIATERAAANQMRNKVQQYLWVDSGLGKGERKILSLAGIDLPSWEEATVNLLLEHHERRNPVPHPEYQSYEIENEPLKWNGTYFWDEYSITYGGIKRLYLVTDWDEKARLDNIKAKRDADLNKVNETRKKLEALLSQTQEKIEALQQELATTETALKQEAQNSQGLLTAKGEELKNKVAQLKAKLTEQQAESQKQIDAVKREIETAEKNLQQSNQEYEAAIADAKERMQQKTQSAFQILASSKAGFLDRLGNSVKQFTKKIGEKIESSLDGIDVGAVLDVLKKIPYVGTVVNGIEGLIALIGGDWKTVVEKAIKAALGLVPGGSEFPDPVVGIFVNVAWAIVVDKKYDQALKNILINNLKFHDKLPNGKYVADVFVDVAWPMKDGDWKDVLSKGLSGTGFNHAEKFVDIAWAIKDGDYKKALSTGLSTTGFPNADKFVDVAWAVKDGDYKKALSAGLETAGLGNAGTFVGNVFDAIKDDYSLPGQSIDPAAIPQKHKLYEYLARGIAYEDPEVSAIAEEAFSNSSLSGNKLAVGEELLVDKSYKVNKVISDPNTGFYAVGLVSTNGNEPPVLAVRGTAGSPTERQGIATLKDVLEDANPISIGYSQFQANKNEIEAWLAAQNQQGRRPDVVGHSLGGALAQTIAAEFTDKVGQTVTFNSPGIDDSIALKFAKNKGNPENVTHYVVSGDIVHMAGEAFLPGQAVLSSYSNPFVWKKHGLAVLNGVEIKGEQKASGVKFSSLSVIDLSKPAFHYRELDYSLFLAGLGLLSPSLSTALSTRGTAETTRKAIGAFLNSNFQTIQSWVDAAWSIKDGDYLKALSTGFDVANFQNGKNWIDMVQSVKSGDYLKALSTGFDVAKFQNGKDWVDMAWSLKQGDYLKALSTGFKVAGFPEGEHLAKAAVNLREGKYLDAFFEGMYMIPGVEDLVNAFKAVGDGNFKGVANSLAKVAGNPTLLKKLLRS